MTALSKQGILDILSELDTEELISLGNTISQGLMKNKIRSQEDAVEAIFTCSPNEVSILRRKIITKEILFSYLRKIKIPVVPPLTKNDLIDRILEYWKLPVSTSNGDNEFVSSNVASNESRIQHQYYSQERYYSQEGTSSQISCVQQGNDDMYSMAQQFSQWFYTIINQNAPIGTEHFYPDAILKLNLITDGISDTEKVENNPEEICALLFRKRMEHNLFFNPNLSKEGTQGRMDPHGLVIVMTCGTLHVNECCVGVFEQMFALARDPFADNNWKIKNTQLNLRSKQNVISSPRLCDSELTSSYLSICKQ